MGNSSGKSIPKRSRNPGSVESVDEIKMFSSIENLSFFYKDLSRSQAEDIIKRHAQYPGTYLLRMSNQHRRYALTVVADQNLIGHILIHNPVNGCFYAEEEVQFDTMESLIKYYKNNSLPNVTKYRLDTKLRYPVHRFRQKYPMPFQRDAVGYDLVTEKIYSHPREPRLPRFEEERCFYFYEDGKRVMIRTPPNPPQINHFQTSSQIYASPNEHPCRLRHKRNMNLNMVPRANKTRSQLILSDPLPGAFENINTIPKSVYSRQRAHASETQNFYIEPYMVGYRQDVLPELPETMNSCSRTVDLNYTDSDLGTYTTMQSFIAV